MNELGTDYANSSSRLPISFSGGTLLGRMIGQMIQLYLDGKLVDTTAFVGSLDSNGEDLNIGGQIYFNRWFNGTIDEVCIWNRVLNPEEIRAEYDRFTMNLSACWHFDEDCYAIAYDSSGNENDGAINGATWTAGVSGSALDFDEKYRPCRGSAQ